MTLYDRDDVACHLCFRDKTLQDWIKEEGKRGGACPWCGRRGHLIPLERLGEAFREVVSIYESVEGWDEGGDQIGFLLGDAWWVFSEQIENEGLAQELAVSILEAGLHPKHDVDQPDYQGLFRSGESSLENAWDEKAYAALTGEIPAPDKKEAARIGGEIADELPDIIEGAFEDLATIFEEGTVLYRARVHKDRRRKERFRKHELSAPPLECATAGRANRKGEPVLYLARNKSTALAEVRAWKGAAVALAEVKLKRRLLLVDLSRTRSVDSPFFVELLKWKVELMALLHRLANDLSQPVMPQEEEVLYRPTQLLAWLIKSSGYAGFIYPSAMGPGTNIVLFNPDDAEITTSGYVRVKRVACFAEPLSELEDVYEEGPYDFALSED